jgi:hypothetical protein
MFPADIYSSNSTYWNRVKKRLAKVYCLIKKIIYLVSEIAQILQDIKENKLHVTYYVIC